MERIPLHDVTEARLRDMVKAVELKAKSNKLEPLDDIVGDVLRQVQRVVLFAEKADLPLSALRPSAIWRRDGSADETTADTTVIEIRTLLAGAVELVVHRRKAAEHTPRAFVTFQLPSTRGEVRHG